MRNSLAFPVVLASALVAAAASAQNASASRGEPAYKPQATSLVSPGVLVDEANDKQKAEAGAAFKRGMDSFRANRDVEALAYFRDSYSIVASPNSRMMIARTLAKLGRLSDAFREAKFCAQEANAAAQQNAKYKATADSVRAEIAELERSIAFLTVDVDGDDDQTTLTVGGQAIDRSNWGRAVPVNPGRLDVVLTTAKGTARRVVDVRAGSRTSVSIDPAGGGSAFGFITNRRKPIAYAAAGVGGVGMLLFGTFGALSNAQYDRLQSGCPTMRNCDPALKDAADRGATYQTAANVSLAVGLVGIAASASLLAWEASAGGGWPWDSAGIVKPTLAVGPGQVTLSGSF